VIRPHSDRDFSVKGFAALGVLIIAATIVTVAQSGHEFPIYPSYYPHQIRIETMSPKRGGDLLLEGKIQAYVGGEPRFTRSLPDSISAVESLGSFVIVRVNPESSLAKDGASTCAVAQAVVGDIAVRPGVIVFHPYPITPLDGDYLYHVDLADAAKARLARKSDDAAAPAMQKLTVRANSDAAASVVRRDRYVRSGEWDAEVAEIPLVDLVAHSAATTNGWLGPPWIKTGWFHAALLLASSVDDSGAKDRAQAALQRLESGAYETTVERINLERELVSTLSSNCRSVVAGYTVKREYISTEYSAGIENVGFDSIDGLNSPIFIRTVKLKDFPWNGWLSLGINSPPGAAWNPIAGFNDPFGRLMWSALGDPALLPLPNDSRWMLNRVADVQSSRSP